MKAFTQGKGKGPEHTNYFKIFDFKNNFFPSSDKHEIQGHTVLSTPLVEPKNEIPSNASNPTLSVRGPQSGVFARLHTLFPSSDPISPKPVNGKNTVPPTTDVPKRSRSLKLRIVSWNMHESLPKGELDALLGSVPPYMSSGSLGTLSDFGEGKDHPYHVIIVAGQECPSATGLLPMAFGAGNSVIVRERDRDKKTHRRRKGDELRKPENDPNPTPLFDIPGSSGSQVIANDRSTGNLAPSNATSHHKEREAGGWTHILEDWFVRGIRRTGLMVDEVGDDKEYQSSQSQSSELNAAPPFVSATSPEYLSQLRVTKAPSDSAVRKDNQPLNVGTSVAAQGGTLTPCMRAGSYVLAVKERMMGIYLAVYVHRDVEPLVQGTDTDAVPAGLIGGRIGNKGGVGVSLKIAGVTILFVNAHLAAHAGRMDLRMANLCKIKTELSLDTFLSVDDPRQMAEDITDRFDYTFFFGDLNFRLDISRLHADWLISHKEYAQALEFDQLRRLMKDGRFCGFSEGHVNFPPTFKYDVQHRQRSHRQHLNVRKAIQKTKDQLWRLDTHDEDSEEEGDDANDTYDSIKMAEDRQSIASSVIGSSSYSGSVNYISESESLAGLGFENTPALLNTIANSRSPSSGPAARLRLICSPVAQKARSRLHAFVTRARGKSPIPSPSRPKKQCGSIPPESPKATPLLPENNRRTCKMTAKRSPPCSHLKGSPRTPDKVPCEQTPSASLSALPCVAIAQPTYTPINTPLERMGELVGESRTIRPQTVRSRSVPAALLASAPLKGDRCPAMAEEIMPGVYDTSPKQRVPSWCDRILYKSTVIPDVEEASPEHQRPTSRGFRVGRKIINSIFLKTRSSRDLTPSAAFTHLPQQSQTTPTNFQQPALSSAANPKSPCSTSDSFYYSAIPLPRDANLPTPRVGPESAIEVVRIPEPSRPDTHNPQTKRSFSSSSLPFLKKLGSGPPISMSEPLHTGPRPRMSRPRVRIPSIDNPVLTSRPASGRPWFLQLPSSVLNHTPLGLDFSPNMSTRKRGEVTCLSYHTLDDREMVRLRGKSDHRPIIGVYSICIE